MAREYQTRQSASIRFPTTQVQTLRYQRTVGDFSGRCHIANMEENALSPSELDALKKIANGEARTCPPDCVESLLRLKLVHRVPGGLELTGAGLERASREK